jgi:aspartokinase
MIMANTTQLTEQYLDQHPYVKDCLKKGIINYSRLSRIIAKELSIEKKTSMEAILIACRRYALKIKKDASHETKILSLLTKSQIEIKNRIVTVIIDKKVFTENLLDIEKKIRAKADMFYAIEGASAFTIIVSEKYLDEIKEVFKRNIIKVTKDLALITLKSDEDLEDVPGVVSFIYSLFSENGINIVETMSCWTDTIVLIKENDISNVMKFLKF